MKNDQNKIIFLKDYIFNARSIMRIIKKSYDKRWLIGSIYLSPAIEYYIDSLAGSLDNEFYGIIKHDKLIAFMHLKKQDCAVFLNHIGVLPEYSGLGFGSSLLDFAVNKAASEKKSVILHVNDNNKKAIMWYHNKGFCVESRDRYSLLSINKKSEVKFRCSSVTFEDRSVFDKYGFGFGYITWKENKIKFGIVSPDYIKILNHELLSEEDIVEWHKKYNCNLIIPRAVFLENLEFSSAWSVFTMKYRYG